MTVKEYAIRQLHGLVQEDPWVRAIFLAAGETLNTLAERILDIYNSNYFDEIKVERVRYFEKILGLPSDESKALRDRRAAIQAAWNVITKPTLQTMQAICDSWQAGGVIAGYAPGVLTLHFIGDVGIPANVEDLKRAIEQTVPAHILVEYAYRYLLIKEIHGEKTLKDMETLPLNYFAGGA